MYSAIPKNKQDDLRFFEQEFAPEKRLLHAIRCALVSRCTDSNSQVQMDVEENYCFSFHPEISQLYITLFQTNQKPLRWGSRKTTLHESITDAVKKLSLCDRFKDFAIEDEEQCRIMFEIIVERELCNPKRTTILRLGKDRFEPGIDGLMFSHKGRTIFFMPTDAYVYSLMTMKQIYEFLAKRTGLAQQTDSKTRRASLVRALQTDFYKIRSFAFITSKKNVLALYRGNTLQPQINAQRLKETMLNSCDWLVRNMRNDGRFLYFYDGSKDSTIDFNHPKNPNYYNILRHSGGTITLLRAYELRKNITYLQHAEVSIKFLLLQLREHSVDGEYACYPFYNAKSKLGGAGIALVSLMHHHILTSSKIYVKQIEGLARHILSRIDERGEMIGYFIHPLFNKGEEIREADNKTKRALFSFYYPGEALFGLALYYRHFTEGNSELKEKVLTGAKKAMDFLVFKRPQRYKDLFLSLPADAWLMQAIEEWIKVEVMNLPAYTDFIFHDADAMISHMYRKENSPYPDYIGGFFYKFGEHILPDGSRCEGLIAAYETALYLGRTDKANLYKSAMMDAALNLMYTYNSYENTYAHKIPANSIGSFRFKFTRQWIRVDSIQHTACFFARFYKVLMQSKPV
ncbi:protein containing Six-hairpin glycosidase-like domain protein [bacterium]|nr:protein containing Six-hairpin glycosidase-like domain protein [bacterium]MBU1994278.1 protein containing Six-hairpin glycosidase-like domain protein [bacterium]